MPTGRTTAITRPSPAMSVMFSAALLVWLMIFLVAPAMSVGIN